jgi:hypothetical protein
LNIPIFDISCYRTTSKGTGSSKQPSKKHKEVAATADTPEPDLQAIYQLDLKKAKEDAEKAKVKAELAAQETFPLYKNLLPIDAKYTWDKIIQEQTQSDPYVDPQGVSRKGPRGYLRKAFDNCMIFHLLTVLPNNTAVQEWYCITNVLKKPQHVSVHQFVQHVKWLNSYIVQLPCWYYSPSAKPSTIHANILFTEADLASHVLWMCPLTWEDHFNLHKKGMTPVDMRLLLMSLKAIECICTQEKSDTQSNKKASNKGKKGNKSLVLSLQPESPRKFTSRSIATSARGTEGCILRTTQKIVVSMRKMDWKSQFPRHQERRKEPNPTRNSFTQMSKKLEKLEKSIKKQGAKLKKHHRDNSNSKSE